MKQGTRYFLYSFLFWFTFLFFFILPEYHAYRQHGWLPRPEEIQPLPPWNPLKNLLVRFFLVAAIVGFFYQKMKAFTPGKSNDA